MPVDYSAYMQNKRDLVPNLIKSLAGAYGAYEKTQAANQMAERQAQMQFDFASVRDNPNSGPQDYANLMMKYPEQQQRIKGVYDMLGEEKRRAKQAESLQLFSLLEGGENEMALKSLNDRRLAAETSGNQKEAQQAQTMIDMINSNPSAAKNMAGMYLSMTMGPDKFAEVYAKIRPGGKKTGLASAKTEIYDNGTIVQALPSGETQVINPEGKIVTGKERVKVLTTARKEQVLFAGEKARAGAVGKAEGEAQSAPLIAKAKSSIERAVTAAKVDAKAKGESVTDLSIAEAALPGLKDVVSNLKELTPLATSTMSGKIWDLAVKETGFGATKGATARAKYIAIIDNQLLPLLRQTFGAAFTVKEGEQLKATLGDPDAAPAVKNAQLDAFIEAKYREIETKQRQVKALNATVDQSLTEGSDKDILNQADKILGL